MPDTSTTTQSGPRRRLALAGPIAVLVALVLAPAPAQADGPAACFTVTPASPLTGEATVLDSTCSTDDHEIAGRAWDLDNDGSFDDGTAVKVTKTWSTPGTYTVRLAVVDDDEYDIETKSVVVRNRAPTAAFTFSPATPTTASIITFTSTSTDSDGTIQTQAWDLDGDATVDFNDGTAKTASKSFATAGTYPIRLRVTDNNGATNITTRNVVVGNRSPRAVFSIDPASILEGDTVTLTSSSADPDGFLVSQAWDTDGDGAYDDASGSIARFTAGLAGNYEVGLRVVDDKGAWTVARQTITVGARPPLPETRTDPGPQTFDIAQPIVTAPSPAEPEPPAPVAPYRFLDPFPVVRMKGRTTARGVRLTSFTVRAPHGSLVQLTCKGRPCPFKRVRKTIETRNGTGSATIHFRQAERSLRAGVELQVAVTQEGMVGKFTRIKVRRLALPIRSDRCLLPGSTRPSTCPTAG